MNWQLIEIILILFLIERITICRNHYRIGFSTYYSPFHKGNWQIWIYKMGINDSTWSKEKCLIDFKWFVIPIFK